MSFRTVHREQEDRAEWNCSNLDGHWWPQCRGKPVVCETKLFHQRMIHLWKPWHIITHLPYSSCPAQVNLLVSQLWILKDSGNQGRHHWATSIVESKPGEDGSNEKGEEAEKNNPLTDRSESWIGVDSSAILRPKLPLEWSGIKLLRIRSWARTKPQQPAWLVKWKSACSNTQQLVVRFNLQKGFKENIHTYDIIHLIQEVLEVLSIGDA